MCFGVGFALERRFHRPVDPDQICLLRRRLNRYPRLSPLDPRYQFLRGENLFVQHVAMASSLAEEFSRHSGIEMILGLGSLARGFADNFSDLDIAVLARGPVVDRFWRGERWLAGISVDLFVIDLDSSPPERWDVSRRQAFEESIVLYGPNLQQTRSIRRSLRLTWPEQRRNALDLLFKIGWLGFAPRAWFNQIRYGYCWSLPPDGWLQRNCLASAHITVDRVEDMLLQLLFLLNRRHVPDAKWRRFLAPGLPWQPSSFESRLSALERTPRDEVGFPLRSDLLLDLIEQVVDRMETEGYLCENVYTRFLKSCLDYDPRA
jgi:predicted nucleotidyltransferase